MDHTVEITDNAGHVIRTPLSAFGVPRRPLDVHILRRADQEEQRFPNQFELVLQTYVIPLDELMKIFRNDPFLMVFTCVTAGFVEELLFRGYLLPRLALLFNNSLVAVIVSSVLFGLMHFGYGTVINMVGPFIIGLVFAIYYWKFRNIKVLIFCHFTWDLMALLLKLLLMKYHIKN